MHSVILYSTTKNKTTRKIYWEVCETFGQGVITEQKVGKWRRAFTTRWRDVPNLSRTTQLDTPITGNFIFQLLVLRSLLLRGIEIFTVLYKPTHHSLIAYMFLSRASLFLLRCEPSFWAYLIVCQVV